MDLHLEYSNIAVGHVPSHPCTKYFCLSPTAFVRPHLSRTAWVWWADQERAEPGTWKQRISDVTTEGECVRSLPCWMRLNPTECAH